MEFGGLLDNRSTVKPGAKSQVIVQRQRRSKSWMSCAKQYSYT
jgi:hypothetical protein